MRALDFAVELRRSRLDVDMADTLSGRASGSCAELDAVIGLDDLNTERQALQHVAGELAQVDDLAHDLGAGGVGTDLGAVGAVPGQPRPCWS
jgi:hypothetical protein